MLKRFQTNALSAARVAAVKFLGGLGGSEAWASGGSGARRNRDLPFTESGAATAFGVIVEVQRGVMFIADSLRMLPAGIYDSKTKELLISLDARDLNLWTPGAPFVEAIRDYERRHLHNFFDSIAFSDWLYGETFTVRLSNTAGGVTGLRWLNPLYTDPMTTRGRIEYYNYSGDDGYFEIPRADMAYRIHHRNPYDDLRGISPVLSALPSMNISRDAEREIMGYFQNGMILGGLMMPEGDTVNLSETQMKRIERDMQQKHQGVDNAHRWVIAPTRMSFETFDQPDLQKNYGVVKDTSKKIMMALGVPPELAGNPDSVSYDNADKIMTNWLRVNGKAYASKVASYINTSLLPYFEPDAPVYFAFDFTKIDQQDAALVQTDFDKGLIPMDVAQAQRGYEVDERVKGIYNLGGKFIHIDTLVQTSRDPATLGVTPTPLMLHMPPGQPLPGQPPPTLPAPPTIQALPEQASEPQKGAASLYVNLSLTNNPDLIALQKRLKVMYPDPAVRWIDPAEFHLTLVSVPAVDEDQIAAVLDALPTLSADDLSLKVGSLACFDNVGEHALHFRISRNSVLLDLQAALYDACDINGLQMSGYSLPERYTARVTMAYLPETVGRMTFHGKVSVQPRGLICSVERGGTYETVYPPPEEPPPAPEKSAASQTHTHDWPVMARDYSPEKALSELKAWHNFVARGKSKRPFVFDMLKGDPADEISARLAAGETPISIVRALTPRFDGSQLKALETAFDGAIKALLADDEPAFIKSVDGIRSEFSDRLTPVIESLRDGSLDNRRRAGQIIRQLVRSFGARAYRQGLADAGVDDTPDAEEQKEIDSLLADSSTYISNFTDTLINGSGLSEAQAVGRADMWFNGSISPLYSAGLLSGNKNQMMEFGGDDGEETCEDCPRLKGQRHRAKDWKARNLDVPRIGQATQCGGWKCFHKLFPVTGRAKGRW